MTLPTDPLLLDTDVLIDYLRGRTEAVDYIDNLANPLIVSVITVGELYAYNERWVVRALHRGEHLDEVDAALKQ